MSNPAVLYVEDDPKSRKVMHMLLENRMKLSNVTVFEDSENFIDRVLALDPQPVLIFLDIHVEPLNGFEMLGLLRQQPQFNDVLVVALTASVMNEEVQQLKEAGFNGCLAKPLDPGTFPTLFHALLNGEMVWSIAQ